MPNVPEIQLPPNPTTYLVPRVRSVDEREWDFELPTKGLWKVTGEAGSGVSSFLIDTVMHALRSGADPDGILVVTTSKESGARLRRELSDRVANSGFVANEPLVRSVHSLAFALLRQGSDKQIRLISGAEQDAVIRDLLRGNAEFGTGSWPAELRPALTFVGFARQLRDFLLRVVERRMTPETLRELGRLHQRPMWSAAGDFLDEYNQVMKLWGTDSYSASELVAQVLQAPFTSQWHTVLVDDAQHLDPASAELVARLLETADLGVVGGDAEQSVFHFRGGSPKFFAELQAPTIHLGSTRRIPTREVIEVSSATAHNATIADRVRRAHLEDEVPWRDIAVVVRSSGMIEPVRRTLLAAGVPVSLNPTDVVLSEQRIVAAMVLGLRALIEDLTVSEWRDLLLGPVGGADPVTLRRLLRGLRRFDPATRAEVTLQKVIDPRRPLPEFGAMLTQREIDILLRIRSVLEAGQTSVAAEASVEEILWAVWNATGLSQRLMAVALRGGATGSQADRDLDAMMTLFDAAGDFAERRESAGLEAFISHINDQELPTGVRDRRTATPDAVALLTAHGVAGREFSHVLVAGVQEGSWPSLGETGSLFGQEDVIDLLDSGVDPNVPVSHSADRLKEERRLFHVATTRATSACLVTTINAPEDAEPQDPSRFVDEFRKRFGLQAQKAETDETDMTDLNETGVRVLAHDHLVAELRRVLINPELTEETRRQASRQLARLVEAGVPGVHPDEWATTTTPSSELPLPARKALSPSRIEALLACPLRAVLEETIEQTGTIQMIRGSLVHAYFEAIGNGADEDMARRATLEAYLEIRDVPRWKEAQDLESFERILDRTSAWLTNTRSAFETVGSEVEVNVAVTKDLTIRGRIDRLEKDGDGAAVIIDLKTGKYAPTADQTRDNPQLTAYQLALSHGVLDGDRVVTAPPGDSPLSCGGAALVYPAVDSSSITTREQVAKTAEELQDFADLITPLTNEMQGPHLTARTGDHCTFCQVRHICPVQPEGKDITRG
ncbi:ATP-dependent DNA helicase [Corynebacterium breve]|uniref:DNA 3'-5' helicase n=1 Tax=Corynebacterium breve TaxID=3049799 RepID=A0ABY8VGU3_9CORY|nr:ATP-dependent DNA helicase [Corynebacterium breve]WIM68302.1 ATP-dependent DNA helicase [Corynebacterium breve]